MTKKIFSKRVTALSMAAVMAIGPVTTAFAAPGWRKNDIGWWYATNDDGSQWLWNTWAWLDGNNDGIAERYYFAGDGYIYENTEAPSDYSGVYYTVNADGAWTVDGVVQTMEFATQETIENSYDDHGFSTIAMDLLDHTVEEACKKYPVDYVVSYGIGGECAYLKDGFVYSKAPVSTGLSTEVFHIDDNSKLFKYYDPTIKSATDAEKYLLNTGLWHHQTKFGDTGTVGTYGNGTDLGIGNGTGSHKIQWRNFKTTGNKTTSSLEMQKVN